ncbi:hypothetical protein CLHUN_11680 [Ruminiclostridium hungatei]|uniref:Uncharacterized protein n=1 Tax=Ruminiclostridium hungatei TaxID=48256 RepID=A0A1V4SN82_RUMHU|nr:hypothetical protein [Ruminiclostridium hungatei]OPX44936.1 hypothetical protein CLHUN_11680 [Ruminiclostridium hungatei]
MNREFVKKLVKAEMLRYEALKEILPENMKSRLKGIEREAGSLIKDIAFEFMAESLFKQEDQGQEETSRADHKFAAKNTPDKSGGAAEKTVRQVEVDFN